MGEGKSVFKILTAKRTQKRPLGRPWHRWEDNIRVDLKEIGINVRKWVDLPSMLLPHNFHQKHA